jgi:hypothetical protein
MQPLNTMMLIATPIHGSHYLVDLLAGVAVAATAATVWMFGRIGERLNPQFAAARSDAGLNPLARRGRRSAVHPRTSVT